MESHTSDRYWYLLDSKSNGVKEPGLEIKVTPRFRLKIMDEVMEPVMVIKPEGFVHFKTRLDESDPLKARTRFISPLRANLEVDPSKNSTVSPF